LDYVKIRLTGPVVPKGHEYLLRWDEGDDLTNIRYTMLVSRLEEHEHILVIHNFSQQINGVVINQIE